MANEKNITLDNLKTFKKKADATYAKKTDISEVNSGWSLMRSIGTKVYSYLPTNIKPSTSTHAASGAPASAGKCLVDVSFFKK